MPTAGVILHEWWPVIAAGIVLVVVVVVGVVMGVQKQAAPTTPPAPTPPAPTPPASSCPEEMITNSRQILGYGVQFCGPMFLESSVPLYVIGGAQQSNLDDAMETCLVNDQCNAFAHSDAWSGNNENGWGNVDNSSYILLSETAPNGGSNALTSNEMTGIDFWTKSSYTPETNAPAAAAAAALGSQPDVTQSLSIASIVLSLIALACVTGIAVDVHRRRR
jgi:hypothetical protein